MADISPVLQLAAALLSEVPGKTAHVDEIADAAIKRNLNMGMPQSELAQKLAAALSISVKKKGSLFARVAAKKDAAGKTISYRRGIYRLKQTRLPRAVDIHTPPSVDTAYLGKAGELGVISELLFWGYNASLMYVDQGIDIVASKDGHYFHLQVKTSTPRSDGKYYFSIKANAFDANNRGNTFYVFVMRSGSASTYAVLASAYIDSLRKSGTVKGEGSLSLTISADDKGKCFYLNGNKHNVITQFINNFSSIR